jgi:hypothetical protein
MKVWTSALEAGRKMRFAAQISHQLSALSRQLSGTSLDA